MLHEHLPRIGGERLCAACAVTAFERLLAYVAAGARPADGSSAEQFAETVAKGTVQPKETTF